MRSILFILLLSLFSGCSFLINPEVTFIVRNQTPLDFSILTYSESSLLDSTFIKSGEDHLWKKKYREGGDGDVSPFKREVDSLVISFADGKAIIHYCNGERLYLATSDPNCGPTKNLMNFHTGDFEMGKKKKSTRTIVLERSDYDQAALP
ncbi:hypothetical protein [Leadbetterella byssophila]|uniref:Lipoprotein n=1 Tax=Leadbetterella byssophila (strain DSM 17132 / JCM 16389 / KACC 11308 / NBRC 106382 / 4M15) TaxID=649349 RepID=E4RX42_LEAB4|nr:hypothetical protein [Leadbetterella byssophila]ADQ18081.1 hypothetical protein Lbys_2408 [Leadbetterella byssophila DSM 17132]